MATAEDMATVDTPADEAKESTNTNLQLIGLAAVLIIAFAVVLKMRKKK
jgi:LPXTG-motif cell wall-anchored protein